MAVKTATRALALGLAVFGTVQMARAESDRAAVEQRVQTIADDYMANLAAGERSTGLSISVSLPGGAAPVNVVAGQVSNAADAAPVTPETLFQIGSITKSFAAAALLQLQSEGKLDLDDTLGRWLPEYPAWKDVTVRHLLNMTSGIPGYDDTDAAMRNMAAVGIDRHFSPAVLAGFVDPTYPGAPAATTGYDYSNTNYILAGMVIERAGGMGVQETFESRFFGPHYGLTSTYYREGVYPPGIADRTASGYFVAEGFPLLAGFDGADMKLQDMSWAGPAGAIVSRPEEVNRWVRALFHSDLLDAAAREQLVQVVSMKTGDAIGATSEAEPHGFGLGVSGFTGKLGSGWSYEGETMGFRVVYAYLPEKDVVVTAALNSAPEGEADHASQLILSVLEAAIE